MTGSPVPATHFLIAREMSWQFRLTVEAETIRTVSLHETNPALNQNVWLDHIQATVSHAVPGHGDDWLF